MMRVIMSRRDNARERDPSLEEKMGKMGKQWKSRSHKGAALASESQN